MCTRVLIWPLHTTAMNWRVTRKRTRITNGNSPSASAPVLQP